MFTVTRGVLRRPKLGKGLGAALQGGYIEKYAAAATGADVAGAHKASGGVETPLVGVDAEFNGGAAYTQFNPPEEGGEVEAALTSWLSTQATHSQRVDRMKSSRLQRLSEQYQQQQAEHEGHPPADADPFPLRVAFYEQLLASELLFMVQGNEAQLFSIDGSQAAMCFFTSMRFCEAFAAGFAEKVVEGGLSQQRVKQVTLTEEGNVVAVDGGGKEVELMSRLDGTWQPGYDCMRMVRTDDLAAVNRLKILVNPLSDAEAHIPFLHIARMVDGDVWSLLAGETARVFGNFIEEYCGEVTRAWTLAFPVHPFEGTEADAIAGGSVVLLVLETAAGAAMRAAGSGGGGAVDFDPDAPHPLDAVIRKIAWGKDHTASLESHLTTFSRLHIHDVSEVPEELLEGAKPFIEDGAMVKS